MHGKQCIQCIGSMVLTRCKYHCLASLIFPSRRNLSKLLSQCSADISLAGIKGNVTGHCSVVFALLCSRHILWRKCLPSAIRQRHNSFEQFWLTTYMLASLAQSTSCACSHIGVPPTQALNTHWHTNRRSKSPNSAIVATCGLRSRLEGSGSTCTQQIKLQQISERRSNSQSVQAVRPC